MRSQQIGLLDIKFYLNDLQNISKTLMATSNELRNNSAGPNNNPNDDHDPFQIGKVFIATSTWGPKNPSDTANLSIEIGDRVKITNYVTKITYLGLNLRSNEIGQFSKELFQKDIERSSLGSGGETFTGTSTQRFNNSLDASTRRDDIDPLHNIGNVFTATSMQRSSDLAALQINAGDKIEIVKSLGEDSVSLVVAVGDNIQVLKLATGDGYYSCSNTRTKKEGHLRLEGFRKDIDSASGSLDNTESSRMDLDHINRTPTPSNDSADRNAGKVSFSIKGTSLSARAAIGSANVQESQHFGHPPKSTAEYYHPYNPSSNPRWPRDVQNAHGGERGSHAPAEVRRLSNGMPIVTDARKNGEGADR
ncbi:hypothetical protein DSL72_006100 [Monilinia vaccinii-corymbosi]|uniref:Uncharacterized protein n=1 Tax=Monilinia vaccinii-corymbosi TaxID=61207 RepID=A0A8A3PHQ8_9HELO|nr:hypothetical protein DSL72_006100 [Monilinia vaccinii-corymbosi]